MYKNPEDLVTQVIGLFSLPAIFQRIDEAINDPHCSLIHIGDLISKDVSLTARLLKIANSSLFSFPTEIETIPQAVTIIGMQQLRDLVLATSLIGLFKEPPGKAISMDSFWQHSIACGIAARVIATYRRESNVERFYVAGMLHDIGRLILYNQVPDLEFRAMDLSKANNELICKMEQKEIGFDHAAVGGALMKAWKLPVSLQEMATFHHKPLMAVRYPVETAIIHLADTIACAMQLGFSGEPAVPVVNIMAWDRLDLPVSLLSSIMQQTDRQFIDAASIFIPGAGK